MRRYLELEGKLGPKSRPQPQTQLQLNQPQPSTSAHPKNNNPMTRKAPGPKTNYKRKTTMLAKRRYKVRVITQPTPTTPTQTAPTPTVATTSTQMPVVRSTTTSILVMVYKLATGQFSEVSYPTGRLQNERNPSICSPNPHHLKTYPRPQLRR